MRTVVFSAGVALSLLVLGPRGTQAEAIYWVDGGQIYAADLDGANVRSVFHGVFSSNGLAFDERAGKLYWTDILPIGGLLPGAIRRVNTDGTDSETIVSVQHSPQGIAILPAPGNVGAAKVYWADDVAGDLRRADLDGTRLEIVTGKLNSPRGVALDREEGTVYWSRGVFGGGTAAIERIGLDGGDAQPVVSGLDGPVLSVALDPMTNRLYFGYINPYIDSVFAGMIMRSDLDGANLETVVAGLVAPVGLALDTTAGKVYWSDTGYAGAGSLVGSIGRANLDGTEPEAIIRGLVNPRGLALDLRNVPEPSTLLLTTCLLLTVLAADFLRAKMA